MFRLATPQNTPRARAQTGILTPLAIPVKGLNARDTFAVMGPEFAIALNNVIVEPYGLRTRKGYTEWATGIPPAPGPISPVHTVMVYYPATAAPAVLDSPYPFSSMIRRMMVERAAPKIAPAGKLFASRAGLLYNVTAGGSGPWTAEVGVSGTTDFWTWVNFQNAANSHLIVTNDGGAYSIYNGTTWTSPVQGTLAGQIANVNPQNFVFVAIYKKRLWFIEKQSTRAWYLKVGEITGEAKLFNVGEQMKKGGHLVALANWTVGDGEGTNDKLVFVGSQGDVIVYEGNDPDTVGEFVLNGWWDVGPLPVGRRSVVNTGADVHILSQFGITPMSVLMGTSEPAALEQRRPSYLVGQLIARLMRDYSSLPGWNVRVLAKEELIVVSLPRETPIFSGAIFAYKVTTGAWSLLREMPYASFCNIDAGIFAGTFDGRVVRAFDGPLDDVKIGQTTGKVIQCQVTPAYQPCGAPGQQKVFKLVRPTFVTTLTPTLTLQIMTDYGPPKPVVAPTLPNLAQSFWNVDKWDEGKWSGLQDPIKEWLGCHGVGFAGTVQLDYKTGGDTLLASIDMWTEQGGVM